MGDHEVSDDECLARTAQGDTTAFAILWQRHSSAAYTVARSYRTLDADDLVAESFAKVLRAVRNGGGPDESFRAYLFTTIRNTAATLLKGTTALSIERDLDPDARELAVESPDLSVDSVAARAFTRLPQRWRQVLWHMGVEGRSPRETAAILGLTPNGASALAMRARKAFRREMVMLAAADLPLDSACRPALLAKVGASSDDLRSATESATTPHSAETCNQCRSILRETGTARAALSVAFVVGAAGAEGLRITASTSPAAGLALSDKPVTMAASSSTFASGKHVAVVAVMAAAVAASIAIATGIPQDVAPPPSPRAAGEVRDVGMPSSPQPSPERPAAAASPPPEEPAPVQPPASPEAPRTIEAPSSMGNGAAPYFVVANSSAPGTIELRGLGTPGWIVEAFVANGPGSFASATSEREAGAVCGTPPGSGTARAVSTGPLTGASWTLRFSDLQPATYSVVVVECMVDGDAVVSSTFSTPQTFTVVTP